MADMAAASSHLGSRPGRLPGRGGVGGVGAGWGERKWGCEVELVLKVEVEGEVLEPE